MEIPDDRRDFVLPLHYIQAWPTPPTPLLVACYKEPIKKQFDWICVLPASDFFPFSPFLLDTVDCLQRIETSPGNNEL